MVWGSASLVSLSRETRTKQLPTFRASVPAFPLDIVKSMYGLPEFLNWSVKQMLLRTRRLCLLSPLPPIAPMLRRILEYGFLLFMSAVGRLMSTNSWLRLRSKKISWVSSLLPSRRSISANLPWDACQFFWRVCLWAFLANGRFLRGVIFRRWYRQQRTRKRRELAW